MGRKLFQKAEQTFHPDEVVFLGGAGAVSLKGKISQRGDVIGDRLAVEQRMGAVPHPT